MLEFFVRWATTLNRELIGRLAQSTVTQSKASEIASSRLDVDTLAVVARITFWSNGCFDAEIIELDSERVVYEYRGVAQDDVDFNVLFAPFFQALSRAELS